MKTPKQKVRKPWWKRVLGAFHILLNLGLFLYLAAQGFLVYLLYREGEIRIPARLVDRVERLVSRDGVQLDIGTMDLDMRGILLFRDVKVNLTGYHEAVAEADLILVDFPLWGILSEHFAVNQIWVSKCHLYCPAVLSPTGKRELVVEDIYTEVNLRGPHAEITRLLLRFGNLDIVVKGGLNLNNFKDKSRKDETPDPAKIYAEVCQKLLEARPWVKKFTDPQLTLSLKEEKQVTRAGLRLHTGAFNLGEGIEGAGLSARITVEANDPDHIKLTNAMAALKKISWKGQVDGADIQLDAKLPPTSAASPIPYAFHIAGRDFKGWDLTMEAFSGLINIKNLDRPTGMIHLLDDRNWMNVSGWLDTKSGEADIAISALWDPAYFFQSSLLKDKDSAPKLTSKAFPRWKAHVILGKEYAFESVDAELEFGKTELETLELESVFARLTATPDRVDVHEAILSTSRYTVSGMYWQEFKSKHYRFVLGGHIDPLDISFIIDEAWWDELWKDFTFNSVLPYSNIDIRGSFGGGDEDKFFFGYNRLVDFTYNDVHLDECSAMLWRSPYQLTLYDMHGNNPQGEVDVILQFNYAPNGPDRKSLAFSAAGNLPINQEADLAGPETHEVTDEFTLTASPKLQVLGLVFGQDSDTPNDLYLKIKADIDSTMTYEGYIFDWIKLEAYKTPDNLAIRNVHFGLAQGTGIAQADVALISDDRRDLKLDLTLHNTRYDELLTNVPFFHSHTKEIDDAKDKEEATGADETPPDTENDTERGRTNMKKASIDFDIHMNGTLGDIETFYGHGKVDIANAYFGQLHIFGGLSRATQTIGLNLGTVDFTHGAAPFLVGKGYIHFPGIRVSGPTARVDANGNFNIVNSDVDFYLSLYPLGAINMPVVSQIVSIFNPITETAEARLTGTVKEPKWNVDFNPLSIIMGQNKVDNPTGQTFPKKVDDDE